MTFSKTLKPKESVSQLKEGLVIDFGGYFVSDVLVRNFLLIIKINGEVESPRQRHNVGVIEFSVFYFKF